MKLAVFFGLSAPLLATASSQSRPRPRPRPSSRLRALPYYRDSPAERLGVLRPVLVADEQEERAHDAFDSLVNSVADYLLLDDVGPKNIHEVLVEDVVQTKVHEVPLVDLALTKVHEVLVEDVVPTTVDEDLVEDVVPTKVDEVLLEDLVLTKVHEVPLDDVVTTTVDEVPLDDVVPTKVHELMVNGVIGPVSLVELGDLSSFSSGELPQPEQTSSECVQETVEPQAQRSEVLCSPEDRPASEDAAIAEVTAVEEVINRDARGSRTLDQVAEELRALRQASETLSGLLRGCKLPKRRGKQLEKSLDLKRQSLLEYQVVATEFANLNGELETISSRLAGYVSIDKDVAHNGLSKDDLVLVKQTLTRLDAVLETTVAKQRLFHTHLLPYKALRDAAIKRKEDYSHLAVFEPTTDRDLLVPFPQLLVKIEEFAQTAQQFEFAVYADLSVWDAERHEWLRKRGDAMQTLADYALARNQALKDSISISTVVAKLIEKRFMLKHILYVMSDSGTARPAESPDHWIDEMTTVVKEVLAMPSDSARDLTEVTRLRFNILLPYVHVWEDSKIDKIVSKYLESVDYLARRFIVSPPDGFVKMVASQNKRVTPYHDVRKDLDVSENVGEMKMNLDRTYKQVKLVALLAASITTSGSSTRTAFLATLKIAKFNAAAAGIKLVINGRK